MPKTTKNRLLFIDTETGGLDPGRYSLLSVAMVVWEHEKLIDAKEWLINDGNLIVTEGALAVNKIDVQEHRQTAMKPSKVIEEIFQYIEKYFPLENKIVLAGHNVHFDVSFLKVFFSQNNVSFSKHFSHRIIDTSSIPCTVLYLLV